VFVRSRWLAIADGWDIQQYHLTCKYNRCARHNDKASSAAAELNCELNRLIEFSSVRRRREESSRLTVFETSRSHDATPGVIERSVVNGARTQRNP